MFVRDPDVTEPEGTAQSDVVTEAVRVAGYRGIWFTLGFKFEHGDKYSGGLGTYTANHQPKTTPEKITAAAPAHHSGAQL